MAPKKPKLSPPKPSHAKDEKTYVRIPADLWREVCIATTRYSYVRSQHPQPERFDAAVDEGVAKEEKEARIAASLAYDTNGIIQ